MTTLRRRFWLLPLLFLFSSTGCASLFSSRKNSVELTSTPAGASVYVDGVLVGTAPTKVSLDKDRTYAVTFRDKEGNEATCTIDRSVHGGWVVLDILGGLFPAVVDAITGDWKSLTDCAGFLPMPKPKP